MLEPSSWGGRVLATLFLAGLLASGYVFVAVPIKGFVADGRVRREQTHAQLLQYRALARQRSVLEKMILKQQSRLQESYSLFLRGPSDALASAELYDLARAAIGAVNGRIRSIQVLPTEATTIPVVGRRIGVQLEVELLGSGLAEAIYTLESGAPYIVIDQLTVHSDAEIDRGRADSEPVLEIALELFGIVLDDTEAIR